jgi:hypothetical protein
LIYPYALALLRGPLEWGCKQARVSLSPEVAARKDAYGGVAKRLEHLLIRYWNERYGRHLPRRGSGDTEHLSRRYYLRSFSVQRRGRLVIVSARSKAVSAGSRGTAAYVGVRQRAEARS